MRTRDPNVSPSGWPVFVALGLVTLLIAGMLGLDLVFARRVGRETDAILENSQRSLVILEDISRKVTKLVATNLDDNDIGFLRRSIANDIRDYASFARYPGEREEWKKLTDLLEQFLSALPGTPRSRSDGAPGIHQSINRLVSINVMGNRGNLASIRAAHRQAFRSDALAGAVTIALVFVIAAWLLRVLAGYRRLIDERVVHLREKNAELEAFAGRAAHDLRSPMSPIRGYADLIIESKGESGEVAAMAQRIRKAVDRMARVVDDMLALSTAGCPLPGRASTDAVVAAVIEEMEPELRGVELATKLAGDRVACTEGVLMQILRNLIGNAIKFRSRARPLRIALETRKLGSIVEIAIEDNGVGMDPESAMHAFEPFYRGQMDLEVPGHGLGLAIVDRTTRALGGTHELSSALNQGTRIVLRFPALHGAEARLPASPGPA